MSRYDARYPDTRTLEGPKERWVSSWGNFTEVFTTRNKYFFCANFTDPSASSRIMKSCWLWFCALAFGTLETRSDLSASLKTSRRMTTVSLCLFPLLRHTQSLIACGQRTDVITDTLCLLFSSSYLGKMPLINIVVTWYNPVCAISMHDALEKEF